MSISLNCPHCGQASVVDAARAGETGNCAACGKPFTIADPQNRFAGAAASDTFRIKPTVWGVVFGIGAFMMLLLMLLPAVRTGRGPARRNQCINNLKNIALAMHNHHDVHQHLPLASNEPRTGRPGQPGGSHRAGYGWTVPVLPFLEEEPLYNNMAIDTAQWQIPPFDAQLSPDHATIGLSILRCPSDVGPDHVDTTQSEYQELQTSAGKLAPARSTYVAFAASHFENSSGLGQLYGTTALNSLDGNGAFPFPKTTSPIHEGLQFRNMIDGTSKTVMLCETRERGYAAWIDGQATWVVGAWPGNKQVPTETGAADGLLGWPDADTESRTALGVGSNAPGRSGDVYMTAAQYGAQFDRCWGPSSDHSGGVVIHVFVDGHVSAIMPDIDRKLYLRLISRNGGEPISSDLDF